MPTVIDALIVSLSLDSSNFVKGQKDTSQALKNTREDADKTAKDLQAAGKRGAEYYGALEKAAGSLLAVVGAADLGQYAIKQVDAMRSIQVAAASMNLPTDKLQAYTKFIERMGGSAATATSTLQNLSQLMAAVQIGQGSPEQRMVLGQIGANPNDDAVTVATKFAEWAHRQPANRAAWVTRFGHDLGMDDAQIQILRQQGASGTRGGMAQSLVMTPEQLANAQRTQEAWRNFVQTFTYDLNQLIANPNAAKVLDSITELMKRFPGVTQGILGVSAALVVFGGALTTLRVVLAALGFTGGAGGAAAAGGAGGTAAAGTATGTATGLSAGLATELGLGGVLAIGGATAGIGLVVIGAADAILNPITKAQRIAGLQKYIAQQTAAAGRDPSIGMYADNIKRARATIAQLQAAPVAAKAPAMTTVGAYLKSLGFTDEQAKGIWAGILAESHGDPKSKDPFSTAYGIGNWTKSSGRWKDFQDVFHKDIHQSTFDEQVQFLGWELTHTKKNAANAIRGQSSAFGALEAFIRLFESPAPGAQTFGDLARGGRYLRLAGLGGGGQTSITIGQINVTAPPGSDPRKFGAAVADGIRNNSLVQQANRGLS